MNQENSKTLKPYHFYTAIAACWAVAILFPMGQPKLLIVAELLGELVLGMTWMGIYYKTMPSIRTLLTVACTAATVLITFAAITST